MQTFITYVPDVQAPDPFHFTARSLDYRRLGKQRVECKQILIALLEGRGFIHHPATKMWRGYEDALCVYAIDICREWIRRGYKDLQHAWFQGVLDFLQEQTPMRIKIPEWITDEFVTAHRSNLIRKNPEYYEPKWPETPRDLPYMWPV